MILAGGEVSGVIIDTPGLCGGHFYLEEMIH